MRSSVEYEAIVKEIIQIYLDYEIKILPIDLEDICRKMGFALVPYSECEREAIPLLLKRSSKGFFVRRSHETPATIYYNDFAVSNGEKRFTIAHEIKHYVYNENVDDENNDDLADFFARFFLCPIPFLIVMELIDPNDIVSHCNVSLTAATYANSNIRERMKAYGHKVFDYEEPLLELLASLEYFVYKTTHFDYGTGRWID